jgi:DNA-binding transcriptional ArsR family regulator
MNSKRDTDCYSCDFRHRPLAMDDAPNRRVFSLTTLNLLIAAAVAGAFFQDEIEISILLPIPFLLYSKLEHDKILDNFVRGKLFGFIQANPGEDCNTLMVKLDLPHGTLLYHLKMLEREELVRSRAEGVHRVYYPANTTLSEPGHTRLTGSQETVFGLISDSPGISQIEMADRLGVSNVAVNYHLEALLEKEMISRQRIGLRYHYFPIGSGDGGNVELDPGVTPPA